MNAIVIYKSKYGSTKTYAKWIAEELSCSAVNVRDISVKELADYDTVIYGGGLYAENIAGVSFITKNFDLFAGKKLIIFTTGITPIECRDYYDKMVMEKNFKPHMLERIKVYNYLGKMLMSELSVAHKAALKALKKLMSGKENPSEMEKLLIELCDTDADLTDRSAIAELVEYAKL